MAHVKSPQAGKWAGELLGTVWKTTLGVEGEDRGQGRRSFPRKERRGIRGCGMGAVENSYGWRGRSCGEGEMGGRGCEAQEEMVRDSWP